MQSPSEAILNASLVTSSESKRNNIIEFLLKTTGRDEKILQLKQYCSVLLKYSDNALNECRNFFSLSPSTRSFGDRIVKS